MSRAERHSILRRAVAPVVAAALLSCGGAGAGGGAPRSSAGSERRSDGAEASGRILVVPMQLIVSKDGEESKDVLDLRSDGTVWAGDHEVARVQGDAIVGVQGRTLVTLSEAGVVDVPLARKKATFDANDVLISPEGKGVGVGDDGTPFFVGTDQSKERFPGRFQGFTTEARRTAVILTVLLLMAVASDTAPASSSAPPSASVAPKTP